MSLWDTLMDNGKTAAVLAGIAGAAAMAATDWRSPLRFAQHLFVGTVTAGVATPWAFPLISTVLSIFKVDQSAHEASAAFITGAFGIYALEYALAVWRRKFRKNDDAD
tara:strand:- start:202 stop:525 length:324 start_codon:yes stop_codon:yes gene_type:complete